MSDGKLDRGIWHQPGVVDNLTKVIMIPMAMAHRMPTTLILQRSYGLAGGSLWGQYDIIQELYNDRLANIMQIWSSRTWLERSLVE